MKRKVNHKIQIIQKYNHPMHTTTPITMMINNNNKLL